MGWNSLLATSFGELLPWIILLSIALAWILWFFSWMRFPSRRSMPVGETLQGLTGMDSNMAAKLDGFGIRTDRELIQLTPRGQQELESQLGLHGGEYDGWRREVLSRWRVLFLPAAFRDVHEIVPDPELGGVYSSRPLETDDLTRISGIDQTVANRINSAGIYTFEQLRLMMPEQRACFKQRFHLPGFDFESLPDFGVTAKWLAFQKEPQRLASTSSTEDEFSTKGVAVGERQSLQAAPEHESVSVDGDAPTFTIPRSQFDPELGRVYTSPPPHRDDLTCISGITAGLAQRLNEVGVFTIDQLRSFSPQQRAAFRARFAVPDFDFSQWASRKWEPSSRVVSKAHFKSNVSPTSGVSKTVSDDDDLAAAGDETALSNVTGFAVAGVSTSSARTATEDAVQATENEEQPASSDNPDTTTCRVSATESDPPDDLRRLPHVGSDLAQRLIADGICTFKQIAESSLAEQTQLRLRFGLADVDFPEWQRLIYAWSQGISTTVDAECRSQRRIGWLHSVRLTEIAPGVFDGQQLVAYPEQVVFRGSLPQYWGTTVGQPMTGVVRSLSLPAVRSDINYVRIRRLDTRESVVTDVSKSRLFTPGVDAAAGWNGLGDEYLGARHLGVFAPYIPREVETRFGSGGWGFGHQTVGTEAGQAQAYCWGGRIIPPSSFEISVGRVGPAAGTVVFHSDNPTIWNQTTKQSPDNWSVELAQVHHPINFVRIMRVDTGQAVIIPADRTGLTGRSDHPNAGWNGLTNHHSGADHLGVYHASAADEVQVVYGRGGWGFGHFAEGNDRQAFAWAGKSISKTLFEITVYEQLPSYLRAELLGQ